MRQDFWTEVKQLAEAKKVSLAHSTPFFEFWLLLHVVGYTTRADLVDDAAAKSAVWHELGRDYSTNEAIAREAVTTFIKQWHQAVVHGDNVRAHHQAAATPLPGNPSTEVCRLVRALNDSALPHLRKLLQDFPHRHRKNKNETGPGAEEVFTVLSDFKPVAELGWV